MQSEKQTNLRIPLVSKVLFQKTTWLLLMFQLYFEILLQTKDKPWKTEKLSLQRKESLAEFREEILGRKRRECSRKGGYTWTICKLCARHIAAPVTVHTCGFHTETPSFKDSLQLHRVTLSDGAGTSISFTHLCPSLGTGWTESHPCIIHLTGPLIPISSPPWNLESGQSTWGFRVGSKVNLQLDGWGAGGSQSLCL